MRDNGNVDEVQLYCIEGTKLSDRKLEEKYDQHLGQVIEGIGDAIVLSAVEGKSIWFTFRKLRVVNYGELKDRREGRLLHPHVTRIQQRYALFLQRQGLPRIPAEAVFGESAAGDFSQDEKVSDSEGSEGTWSRLSRRTVNAWMRVRASVRRLRRR